jgi:hypothetical protein
MAFGAGMADDALIKTMIRMKTITTLVIVITKQAEVAARPTAPGRRGERRVARCRKKGVRLAQKTFSTPIIPY